MQKNTRIMFMVYVYGLC